MRMIKALIEDAKALSLCPPLTAKHFGGRAVRPIFGDLRHGLR